MGLLKLPFHGVNCADEPHPWLQKPITMLPHSTRPHFASMSMIRQIRTVLFVAVLSSMLLPATIATPLTSAQLRQLVQECKDANFNPIAPECVDLPNLDTSQVTHMYTLFEGDCITSLQSEVCSSPFNIDISRWNTSSVVYMFAMFNGADSFNVDISGWDTSSVRNMALMFRNARAFNVPLSNWDTSSVEYMEQMFEGASDFNGDISLWNTQSVKNMDRMFANAVGFSRNIGSWNTGAVTNMHSMFRGAWFFNGDISSWNTGRVTTMELMFSFAYLFNVEIGAWDTSNVEDMRHMFHATPSFNGNIAGWDTSRVTSMLGIFNQCHSYGCEQGKFNIDLCAWNLSSIYPNSNPPSEPTFDSTPKLSLCDTNECHSSGGAICPNPTDECVNTDGSFECSHPCVNDCLAREGVMADGACYFLEEYPFVDWPQARSKCAAMGATLATVNSSEQNSALFELWSRNNGAVANDRGRKGGMWIGASDQEQEGSFVWVDGTPVGFTDWANVYGNQQPNDWRNQDCVSYGYSSLGAWSNNEPVPGWVDNFCTLLQPFVCHVPCAA